MGTTEAKTEPSTRKITKSEFKFIEVIGCGGFGRVWRSESKRLHKIFAIKEMQKIRIVQKNSVSSVLNERFLLAILKHPFLVNMQYAFQDRLNLYLVMDYMGGGDLRHHLISKSCFTECQVKFFVCCILMGLEYLHINNVIHRDIKPENLVFDTKGYLRITDFGIARILDKNNSNENSGTPGYMSPEVMMRKCHGIASDYFAVGVIAYECMMGKRPYIGRSRKEIRDSVISKQVQLKKSQMPEGWSLEAADFINKLIQRNPKERLGINGPHELKNHAWLVDVEWRKMLEKKIVSPFKISTEIVLDKQLLKDWKNEPNDINLDYIQNYFSRYNFDSSTHSKANESTLFFKRSAN